MKTILTLILLTGGFVFTPGKAFADPYRDAVAADSPTAWWREASGYQRIKNSDAFALNAFTVELWFKTDQPVDAKFWSGSATLISKATPGVGSSDWTINLVSTKPGQDQGRVLAQVGPQGAKQDLFLYSPEGRKLNDGQWHHVVLTRTKDGAATLFIDGVLAASGNDGGGKITNDRPIDIGGEKWHEGGKMLKGSLKEAAIYERVLSPERVLAHYHAGGGESKIETAKVDPKPVPGPHPEPIPQPKPNPGTDPTPDLAPTDFGRDILPLFETHCYDCHGSGKQKAGLNLSIRAKGLEGGDGGQVILPGKAEDSLVYRMAAGLEEDRMPPKGDGLTDAELLKLRAWIDQGANWPDGFDIVDEKTKAAQKHWAFQPVKRPETLQVKDRTWPQNEIDEFVLAKLEEKGLAPAPPADPHTLLRRASFDLIGLPPSLEQIEAFTSDPDFDDLIEKLLESPHHGERYGRHWLDVVRYADSAGYEGDRFYHHAAEYRDYVIESFNSDKPFDEFVREQLAADEIRPEDESLRYATGIHTLAPWKYPKGVDRWQLNEHERLTNVADTISSTFLGLTAGCARCHDHKFDPISQKDYFGLHAVLAPAQLWDVKEEKRAYGKNANVETKNWVIQMPDEVEPVNLLLRGNFFDPGPEVPPTLFASLPGANGRILVEEKPNAFQSRRTQLADWLVSPKNPLTARVIANRVWAWHFGTGLVRTPNDFGTQGTPPSHPELLDYLASELVRNDWKLKPLHRLIMTSATYQMASRLQEPGLGATSDPDNRLHWRFPRRRLEAEAIWDHLHSTAGTINLKMGGPSVIPPISKDLEGSLRNAKWETSEESEWTRRGVYLVVRRSLKLPFFDAFNSNNPSASCGQRDQTVVSPQALHLLNGPAAVEQARAFAGRLLRESDSNPELVRRAWLYAFGREPSTVEMESSLSFIEKRSNAFEERLHTEPDLPSPIEPPKSASSDLGGAIVEFCLSLFNANEFIYVD